MDVKEGHAKVAISGEGKAHTKMMILFSKGHKKEKYCDLYVNGSGRPDGNKCLDHHARCDEKLTEKKEDVMYVARKVRVHNAADTVKVQEEDASCWTYRKEYQDEEGYKSHKGSKSMMYGKQAKTMRCKEGMFGRRYIKQEGNLQNIQECLKS